MIAALIPACVYDEVSGGGRQEEPERIFWKPMVLLWPPLGECCVALIELSVGLCECLSLALPALPGALWGVQWLLYNTHSPIWYVSLSLCPSVPKSLSEEMTGVPLEQMERSEDKSAVKLRLAFCFSCFPVHGWALIRPLSLLMSRGAPLALWGVQRFYCTASIRAGFYTQPLVRVSQSVCGRPGLPVGP